MVGNYHHWKITTYVTKLNQVALQWFDEHLNNSENNDHYSPRIDVYVIGTGKWRNIEQWPPAITRSPSTFFICSNGRLLEKPSSVCSSTEYVYNPTNPTPNIGGATFNPLNVGPRKQKALENRKDVCIFDTQPFEDWVEIQGEIKAILMVESDVCTTDFVCRICDVWPSGVSINLCEGLQRVWFCSESESAVVKSRREVKNMF